MGNENYVHGHGHEHTPGTLAHEHSEEIMEIFPGEVIKVRFLREDGSYITVHWRDTPDGPELRACGSGPIDVSPRYGNVVALLPGEICKRCNCLIAAEHKPAVGGVCKPCRQQAGAGA